MTSGEILGFGGFIVTNLVSISWFARGVQKDQQETRRMIVELREDLKEHKINGSDLSKELHFRVENLEQWKSGTGSVLEKLSTRLNDVINIITEICIKIGIPFNRRANW